MRCRSAGPEWLGRTWRRCSYGYRFLRQKIVASTPSVFPRVQPLGQPYALTIQRDAEGIAGFGKFIGNLTIAGVCRRVRIPGDRVTAGPLSRLLGRDVSDGHFEALAGIIRSTSHMSQIPAGAQVLRSHPWIGLEPTGCILLATTPNDGNRPRTCKNHGGCTNGDCFTGLVRRHERCECPACI